MNPIPIASLSGITRVTNSVDGPGAVIAVRCDECGVTVVTHSPYAAKPADGGVMFVVHGVCYDNPYKHWRTLGIVPIPILDGRSNDVI